MSDLPLPEPAADQVLDIQHDTDPAREVPPARHIPHLGHAFILFSLVWFNLSASFLLVFELGHFKSEGAIAEHPGLVLLIQAIAYGLSLGTSWWLFPQLWNRPFVQGIQWNLRAARRYWYWLLLCGVALTAAAQGALHFFPPVNEPSMERMMSSTRGAWFTAAFGVLLAPLMEEVAFRGFLLPALATAYDWLLLERTPAALQRWQSSADHSRAALAFAAVFCSVPFALLHAGQLQHAWGAVSILYVVSVMLSLVRIFTRSVACSAAVHAIYNLSVFVAVFVGTGGFMHMDRLH